MAVSSALRGGPRLWRAVLVGFLFALVATGFVAASLQSGHRTLRIDGTFPAYSMRDLAAAAEAIAIVAPTGKSDVHWNSRDNAEWTGTGVSSRHPYIYRDDEVKVVRSLKGASPQPTMTIRGIGGTIGDVTMQMDGQPEWQVGQRYVVFLRQEKTPTKEGSEVAWTVVWMANGVFADAGSGLWRQPGGPMSLTDQDLTGLN